MKKGLLRLALVLCIIALALGGLASCAKPEAKLDTPVVTISGNVASWDAVAGAVEYNIFINNGIFDVDLSVRSYELSDGDTIMVQAVGNGITHANSDWSAPLRYTESADDTDTPGGAGNGGNSGSGGGSGNGGSGNGGGNTAAHTHTDDDGNELCDECGNTVIVIIDFYAINDLHGKFCDTLTQPGVDELSTYLKGAQLTDDNAIILSSGDMWQGTAESGLTDGILITEWMNEVGFAAMTLGNHEFDWGEDFIRNNLAAAEFPFLAINIYDNSTGKLADYCTPSVFLDLGDAEVGIIGAIGDCYGSISRDMVEGVHFKTGAELASLVIAEAERLTELGADFIVYSLHDGRGSSSSGTKDVTTSSLSGYYQSALTDYVDIVFEAHTHKYYVLRDSNDTYHLQGGGENYGITHAEIALNPLNGEFDVRVAEIVENDEYENLADDPGTEALEDKYSEIVDPLYEIIGTVSRTYSSASLADLVAELYIDAGLERWGDEYNIVLGGGFIKPRAPYELSLGERCYADLYSLLPFNNRLVLCSISGSKLKSRFLNNTNSDYHIALSEYGEGISSRISNTATYYVIVDTYSAFFSSNALTVVDYYDESTYARDLLADHIREGNMEIKYDEYTLTEISRALEIGGALSNGEETEEIYYIKGTIGSIASYYYGNMYLTDGNGNEIYLYGLYDTSGNLYNEMQYSPQVGDTITVYATIKKYDGVVEMFNSVCIEIK